MKRPLALCVLTLAAALSALYLHTLPSSSNTAGDRDAQQPAAMLTQRVEGEGWSAQLLTAPAQTDEHDGSFISYALLGPGEAVLDAGKVNHDESSSELRALSLYPVEDVMGYPGFCLERNQWTGRERDYYAQTESGPRFLGSSFSLLTSTSEDYSADLDSDGKAELICNVQFNADGVQRVIVYRLRDGVLEEGHLSPDCYDQFPGSALYGVTAFSEVYDPARGAVLLSFYPQEGAVQEAVYSDLAHFTFAPCEVSAPDPDAIDIISSFTA